MNICIVNCFDTYEHRVDLLLNTFKLQGHEAFVLASDFRHMEKIPRTEKKKDYVFVCTLPYKKNISLRRMRSHMKFSNDVAKYIKNNIEKIDLVWALIPPNSLVKDLFEIKAKYPYVKLVFDIMDLWPETMPVSKIKNLLPFTYWRSLRDRYLNTADCIVTECDLYREKLNNILKGLKVETLYLARPYVEYTPNLHLPEDKIALCYLGSINNIIDIDAIVDIITQCQKIKPVEFHIIGDGENRENLIMKLNAAGAEVIYHGKVYSREEKQQIFDGCHYGLNIMKPSVCVGFTMKSMDYFEFGLPIINNIHGDTWEIIKMLNIGININRVNSEIKDNSFTRTREKRERTRLFFEEKLTTAVFTNKVVEIIKEI